MRLAIAALLGMSVFGCSSAHRATSTTDVDSSPARQPSATDRLDPADPRPVLTLAFWAYASPDYWRPKDLADLYVYPDGHAIRVTLDGDTEPRHLGFHSLTMPRPDLEQLMSLANNAGLSGGGLQPLVPLPEGVQVQDGGAAMFTARNGDIITARAVDQPGTDDASSADRMAFATLLNALTPLCCQPRTDMIDQPFSRWAIVSAPSTTPTPNPQQEWTGPDLSTLNWTKINGDVSCAVVERADWPLTANERRQPLLVLDGRVITRRPLLPHEHDCGDIAASRELLGIDDR